MSHMLRRSRTGPRTTALVVAVIFAACGGSTLIDGDTASNNGSSSGGQFSSQGGSWSNGGATACCLAMPTCDPGDQAIGSTVLCPAGRTCYSRQACCSSIQCVRASYVQDAGGNCGYLQCDPGDIQFFGTCPAGSVCYARSSCDSTIQCRRVNYGVGGATGAGGGSSCVATCPSGDTRIFGYCPAGFDCYQTYTCSGVITCGFPVYDASAPYDAGTPYDAGPYDAGEPGDGGTCNQGAQYYLRYVAYGPNACATIDYMCPAGAYYFENDCGCGCGQDPSCPIYVSCWPLTASSSPLCTNTNVCPLTTRTE